MLEHLNLWLAPWSVCEAGGRVPRRGQPPRWAILDPASGAFLGLVRTSRRWAGSWFGWFTSPVVEVFEGPDESFLLRTWRSWGAWHVCDAEGRPAGTIRGNAAWDHLGLPIAFIIPGEEEQQQGQVGSWRSWQGRELGTFQPANDGIRINFSAELLDEDPFIRMVLLATLLRIE